jgi:hypothetical protein
MIAVILELVKEEWVEERARERPKPFPPLNGRNIGQTVDAFLLVINTKRTSKK